MKKSLTLVLSVLLLGIGGFAYAGLTGPTGGSGLVSPATFCKVAANTWAFCNASDTLGDGSNSILNANLTSATIGTLTVSTSVSGALTVNATSTSAFVVKSDTKTVLTVDTTNGDLFIANGTGLTVGHTAQITVGALLSEFQVLGTSGADSSMIIHRASANSSPAQLFFAKGRDAIGGTTTALTLNDDIANIRFYGSDGTDFGSYAAEIMVSVDAATGNNDLPGRMIFSTTADGDASPTERMRIDSAGLITITGSQTISSTLGVTGVATFSNATTTLNSIAYGWPVDNGTANQTLTTDGTGVLSWSAAGAGANTALSNLASVAINLSLVSDTYNTDALGTSAIGWSDLFLGNEAVIDWTTSTGTSDITLTHSSNLLTLDGGNLDLVNNNFTLGGALTVDAVTGNVDFGSATSTEITNSAAPFLNTAGEVAVDTTDDQFRYFGGSERVLSYKRNKSVVLDEPVDADVWLLWKPQDNITITDIFCITDPTDATGETLIIDIRETNSTGDSGITVDATITCDSDGAEDDGALSNGTIDAGDWVQIDIGAASGTIPVVSVDIWYIIDAE